MTAQNPVTQTSLDLEPAIGAGPYEGLLAPVEALLATAAASRTSTARRLRLLGAVGRRVDSLFQRRAASFRAAGARAAALARRERLRGLLNGVDALWEGAVLPSLRERGIAIHEWSELREDERRALAGIFVRELSPLLTPLTVDATHPFPAVASLALNLAVSAREPRSGAERFIGIEIPPTVPRLLCATPSARLVPVECVIGANLPALLPDLELVHHHTFRVTRDGRPLRAQGIANGLGSRTRTAVRLEVDAAMPSAQRARLTAGLGLAVGDVDASTAPLDLAAVTLAPLARILARGPSSAARVRARGAAVATTVGADVASAGGSERAESGANEAARRRVKLLRHAKSSWDEPLLADRERPLAPRGQRAANAMAHHLAGSPTRVPRLILCSPARRTLETLEPLRPLLADDSVVHIEEALYLAGAGRLLERLRELPDEQPDVLLIGHDPGLHDLALALATADRSPGYRQLREKLPTGSLVELELRLARWRDLAPGTARLVAFTRPRDLD